MVGEVGGGVRWGGVLEINLTLVKVLRGGQVLWCPQHMAIEPLQILIHNY